MQLRKRFAFEYFFLLLIPVFLFSCKSRRHGESSEAQKIRERYHVLLNVEKSDIRNISLYSFVDQWLGVPYKYGGKGKDGIDCSALACKLYTEVYQTNVNKTSSGLHKKCNEISIKDLKEGDLLFFKINSKEVSHVGVYLQNGKFVHASVKKGVTINDLSEAYYKKHFYKAGRLQE